MLGLVCYMHLLKDKLINPHLLSSSLQKVSLISPHLSGFLFSFTFSFYFFSPSPFFLRPGWECCPSINRCMMKGLGAAPSDQRRCFSNDSAGVKNSTKRIADAVRGACCSCLWPLYAKLGISHRQAASDSPEVREINVRQGHFIIVILFFHTLPLTFNFAPELIVCSPQYDWCRRIQVT